MIPIRLFRPGLLAALAVAGLIAARGSSADFEAGQQAFLAGDYATAIAEWRSDAVKGNGRALFQLGQMYEKGLGVPQDSYTAFVLYRVAYQQGQKQSEDAANRAAGALAGGDLARGVAESERLKREKRYLPVLPGAPVAARTAEIQAPPEPPPVPAKPQPAAPPATPAVQRTQAPATVPAAAVGRAYDALYTCNMQLKYQDRGSGGLRDLALFDPMPAPGYFIFGGYAQGAYDTAHGCVLSIKAEQQGGALLALPQRFERVWKDKGTGAQMDGSIWRAVPPSEDYVCLGQVGQTGKETPSVPQYRCVHRCLVHSMPPTNPLWTTENTGADAKIAIYNLPHINSFVATPKDQPPPEILDLDPNGVCR